jgi:hypothetical protein
MTTEELIIAAVRVLGSLPVLWWPFPGAIVAILVDLSDLVLREQLDLGGVSDYQRFDKFLDLVYMCAFLAVVVRPFGWKSEQRWEPVPRYIALALFAYRIAGLAAFEVTGERGILLAFPNVFEVWFLFVTGLQFFRVPFQYTARNVALVAVPLIGIKLLHEYSLHVGQWFEGFTPSEALEAFWEFVTPPF